MSTSRLETTPSQTAGPFFHLGFDHLCGESVIAPEDAASGVAVRGRILDGDGVAVPDAAVEVWQAGAAGVHAGGASGFGRVYTDADGRFSFTTIRPGATPGPGGEMQAPHLVVLVFMRGLLKSVMTRLYFPGDPRNEADPILARHVPRERRHTLIAREESDGIMSWTIVLQGANETVFFEC